MKGSFLKIVVMLLAIAGVVAIGWYLLVGKSAMEETASTDTSVEVTRPQETATAPKPEPAPAPAPKAEEAPAPAAQAPAAPAAPANAAELAALTPEQVGERWNATSEAERAAFITDYVRAAGEANSLAVAREFSRGPVEGRNYELSYAVAQIVVAEYESRAASFIAGTMAYSGRGTEKNLEAAMRYLRHPELLETANALFIRAEILLDEEYANPNREAAVNLLKKTIKVGKPNDRAVQNAAAKLEELGEK